MSRPIRYPDALRVSVVEDLHGHRIADPYRWLEEAGHPATVSWTAEQEKLFHDERSRWSGRDRSHRRLTEMTAVGLVGRPVARGDRMFHTHRDPGGDLPRLVVSEGGTSRTLLDPLTIDPSGGTVLDAWHPSWEGALIACQLSCGGTEDSRLLVFDVSSGEVLDGPIDRLRRSAIAWLPGGDRFYYIRRLPPELVPGEERYHRRIYLHEVGTDPAEDVLVFGDGREATQYYSVSTTADGRWLTVTAAGGASPAADVWLADLSEGSAGRPHLRPVQEGIDARASLHVRPETGAQDAIFVRTHRDAPRGRVMVTSPADPSPGTWRPFIEEDPEAVVEDFAVIDGPELGRPVALVTRTRHAVSEIAVHDLTTGGKLSEVSLPGCGTVGPVGVRPRFGHEAWFTYTDFVTPPHVLRYDGKTGLTEPWVETGPEPSSPPAKICHVAYTSNDGALVRMFVISPTGRPDRPRPTLLSGYGGFGKSMAPRFMPEALAWVEAGGVYAIACVRGGGEEGEEWHRAGWRDRKQNTFDDFHAAADWLVDNGWTKAGRLGMIGGSNGGLLVGAALTQHPEKYAAAVCVAPLLDMVRYELSGMGPSWREEYGSAAHPPSFANLLAYSPYHRVREGTPYPAVLFGVFDGDTRVDASHARKMCAALQHASSGDGPVLFRLERGVGHGARAVSSTIDLIADFLAFLADRLGLDLEQGSA